jgi:hypothetical protein
MGISQQEALDLFNSDDLIGIGMAANEVRRKKTDARVATYQIATSTIRISARSIVRSALFTALWARKTATSCRWKPSTKKSKR